MDKRAARRALHPTEKTEERLADETTIFSGWKTRKADFQKLVQKTLAKAMLKPEYLKAFTRPEAMENWERCFTHKTANKTNNYETSEALGDRIAAIALNYHFTKRFPKLIRPDGKGVKYLARMQIVYGSKQIFASLAEELGFTDYIQSNEFERKNRQIDLQEDVFEAFFHVMFKFCEENAEFTGYAPCCLLMNNLMAERPISLKWQDLWDAKTRLKETIDFLQNPRNDPRNYVPYGSRRIVSPNGSVIEEKDWSIPIEKIYYNSIEEKDARGKFSYTCHVRIGFNDGSGMRWVEYPKVIGNNKMEAEQSAADVVLSEWKKIGWERDDIADLF
jgi:dsRNA-specific ribonuclease